MAVKLYNLIKICTMIAPFFSPGVSHPFRKSCHQIGQRCEGR